MEVWALVQTALQYAWLFRASSVSCQCGCEHDKQLISLLDKQLGRCAHTCSACECHCGGSAVLLVLGLLVACLGGVAAGWWLRGARSRSSRRVENTAARKEDEKPRKRLAAIEGAKESKQSSPSSESAGPIVPVGPLTPSRRYGRGGADFERQ